MSSYNDIHFLIFYLFIDFSFFLCSHGTNKQSNFDSKWFQFFCQTLHMLFCKNFCRYHNRTLMSVFRRHKQSKNCNNCLTGTNVSEQYAIKAPTLYGKVQAVLDYLSGMTDVYALDLYRKINGNSLPAV